MKTEYDVDVLIVGYGAAGANAAISAHDAGARVLIVEKQVTGGGNSAVCAGGMVVPADIESAISYYRALSHGTVSETMILAFAKAMVGIPDLLLRLGVEYASEPLVSPTFPSLIDCKLKQFHIKPTGEQGFQFLDGLVKRRGIEVLLNTQVKGVIQNTGTREVLGVVAQHDGEEIHIKARKGVVLACGGYASNPEMLANFNIPGVNDSIFSLGSPGNTGDGVHIATQAGAALWHMASIEWGRFCAKQPSKKFGTAVGYGIGRTNRPGSYIFVNKYGERFMAEDSQQSHYKSPLDVLRFDHQNAEYKNLPAYMIFDQKHFSKGPIAPNARMFYSKRGGVVGYSIVEKIYDWSEDNQAELNAGWLIKADTVKELANKIGADSDMLENTMKRFNRDCKNSCDSQFGRNKKTLRPFQEPPYYAVELGVTIINTQGGPQRNEHCQVMNPNEEVIPRLYAAGELGSVFGFLYQAGSNYPEAWAFGEIAGLRAAAETPWCGAKEIAKAC